MEVPYKQAYENYTIAVIPLGDQFDVQFMMKNPDRSVRIELCNSEHHAVKGAKMFPTFYELALKHGYRLGNGEFLHSDGRTLDVTCAMDTDRTTETFEALLLKR